MSHRVLDPEGTIGKAGLELEARRAGLRGRETKLLYSGHSFKAICRENKKSLCACSWQWLGRAVPDLGYI